MEQNPKSCVAWNLYSWTYSRVQVAEPLSGAYDKYEQQACLSSEQGIKSKSCLYYFLLKCYDWLIILLPEKSAKPKTKAEPSTFTKINNSTKAFFAKSKALVPSWLMPETQDRVRQSSQSLQNSATNIRQEVRTAKRKTLLPWISKPEPEPKKPETVPDFLALPKPGY